MAKETETKSALCPVHGEVEATREIPATGFPFIYFAVARALARRRRPFTCPQCGEPVTS